MVLHKPPTSNVPVLNLFSLKGKVAAVTGGARGIGLEICRGLAEAGSDVAMLYRTSTDAPAKAAEMSKATGVTIKAYQANVEEKASITAVLEITLWLAVW